MWDAPDFRVPYDLKVLPIFDHAHPIIIKLTLAFLNFYQHTKKSAHFINPLSWDTADFRVLLSKRPCPFLTHNHPTTSSNKHDWNPVTYLNVLHQNRTKKQLGYFLIYCKNLTILIFGYFGHVWISSKIDNATFRSFDLDELQNKLHS